MSCESEINPKWKHAIDSNVCPFCGQNVMEEQLKKLFFELRLTMDNLLVYSDQLNDWLLSNYGFISIESPLLINYVSKDQLKSNSKTIDKVKTDKNEEEVLIEKSQVNERTSDFFKRAEAVRPNIDGFNSPAEKTQYLKNLTNQIKNAGTSNNNEKADPEDIAKMQELISESDSDIKSSLLTPDDDDDIPAVVLAMANKGKQSGTHYSNNADLLKLQQMRDRVYNSYKNFESGENLAKGGFSRSG